MSGDKIILTREGYEKLKAELDHLTSKKRIEIADALKYARGLGDLRENAEYESAKHAQALNEKRIAELGDRLMRAQILDAERIPKDQAFLGATITLKDLKTDETIRYTLVSAEEANFSENKISVTSPVGKSLLGRKIGETVSARAPAGELKYEILKIER